MSELPPPTPERIKYLNQLVDLLPAREALRVRREVDALIWDRADALREVDPEMSASVAEIKAIEALGPADALAEQLFQNPLVIPLATRRSFVRTLWIVFGGHLLLSIILTAAGSDGAAVPGILAPLAREPLAATLLGVLSIFLIDLGGVFALFWILHRRRGSAQPFQADALPHWTRRDAVFGLVMLALLAGIVNLFATRVFAMNDGGHLRTFLSQDLVAWIPWINIALACFAARMIVTLTGTRPALAMIFDVAGCLAAAGWMVGAATRSELVNMPGGKLGAAAPVLSGMLTRVFLLLLIVGALGLTARGIRTLLRVPKARAVLG